MGQCEECGQLLAGSPEPIRQPTAQGGRPGGDAAIGQCVQRLAMVVHGSPHGSDHAQFVDHTRQMRQERRQLRARLTVFTKLPQPRHDLRTGLSGIVELQLAREGFPGPILQQGLWIEEVHLARAPDHQDGNHGPGAGRMVARLRFQIIRALFQLRSSRSRQKPLLLEEPRQGGRTQTEGAACLQEVAAGAEAGRRRHVGRAIHGSVEVEESVGTHEHLAQGSQRPFFGGYRRRFGRRSGRRFGSGFGFGRRQ